MIKKNFKFFIFVLIFLLVVLVSFDKIRSTARNYLPDNIKFLIKKKFFGEKYLEEVALYRNSFYNQKVLPETQFLKINLDKINIKYLNQENKILIEDYGNYLLIISSQLEIILLEKGNNKNQTKINYTLPENFKFIELQDFKIFDGKLYLATREGSVASSNCSFLSILTADINVNSKSLNFKKIYKSENCSISNNSIKIEKNIRRKSIFIATSANFAHGLAVGEEELAQDNYSIYGKILEFNIQDNSIKTIAKGVRFPKSILLNNSGLIFSDGYNFNGDELNFLKLDDNNNKIYNYGWPEVSIGEDDNSTKVIKDNSEFKFKKNHSQLGYEEPIISFVPSILINSLIKIPKDFSKLWGEDYLMSAGKTIYRIRFDENFYKVLYYEKIIVNDYAEDIVYSKTNNRFYISSYGKLLLLNSD
jgi:hypothetical protein